MFRLKFFRFFADRFCHDVFVTCLTSSAFPYVLSSVCKACNWLQAHANLMEVLVFQQASLRVEITKIQRMKSRKPQLDLDPKVPGLTLGAEAQQEISARWDNCWIITFVFLEKIFLSRCCWLCFCLYSGDGYGRVAKLVVVSITHCVLMISTLITRSWFTIELLCYRWFVENSYNCLTCFLYLLLVLTSFKRINNIFL